MTTVSRTCKLLAGTVAATSLGVGALAVAAVGPLGTAGAQEDEAAPTAAMCGSAEGEGGRRERPHLLEDVLEGLVADATLTEEQADAVQGGLHQRAEEWRAEHPRSEHPRSEHGPFGRRRARPVLRGALAAAAEAIGVEPHVVRQARCDGSSIAEVAEGAGVGRQAVVDAIVVKASERIDRAVVAGRIDEERATELKADLPTHAARIVDAQRPPR